MSGSHIKRLQFHEDLSLEDFEGEIWLDVIGYDGAYNVSNYGRVKSLRRYAGKRLIKDRILKQTLSILGEPTVKISLDGVKKTKRVATVVADAFLGDRTDGQCVVHLNKIRCDNRVDNLKIDTFSASNSLNFKLGVSQDWGISSLPKAYRAEFVKKNVIFEGGETRIICQKCFIEKPDNEFYLRSDSGFRRHICKACQLSQSGVKDVGGLTNRMDMASRGLRYCSTCKELKNLDQDFCRNKRAFMGRSNNCRACTKAINDRNNLKRRNKHHDAGKGLPAQ